MWCWLAMGFGIGGKLDGRAGDGMVMAFKRACSHLVSFSPSSYHTGLRNSDHKHTPRLSKCRSRDSAFVPLLGRTYASVSFHTISLI